MHVLNPKPLITPTVAINSVLAAVNKYLLLGGALGSNKLILKEHYACTKNCANVKTATHNQTLYSIPE